jgi:hypothetical protein
MMSIVESFEKTIIFFDELKKEGLITDYALIGGLALSAWVEPRTTKEVDIVVVISKNLTWQDIASLIKTRLRKKAILQKGNKRTAIQEKLSFMMGHVEVDLISTKGFGLAAEAVEHALSATVFDKSVKVASPEYLILLKLLPLSLQDEVDISVLMREADLKKLKMLAEKHSLLTKLETLLIKPKRLK